MNMSAYFATGDSFNVWLVVGVAAAVVAAILIVLLKKRS